MISNTYKQVLEQKHSKDDSWGGTGVTSKLWHSKLEKFISTGDRVLDFGCGKGRYPVGEKYDPGVESFSELPRGRFDVIFALDVMEHIEPDHLDEVLEWIRANTDKAFFSVCTRKAYHVLPDGRNAHLIVEDSDWWVQKFNEFFFVGPLHPGKGQFFAIELTSRGSNGNDIS